jgi:hypothetical protein
MNLKGIFPNGGLFEINPLLVHPQGQGAALDALLLTSGETN